MARSSDWRQRKKELVRRARQDFNEFISQKEGLTTLGDKYHVASKKSSILDLLTCRLVILAAYKHLESDEEQIIKVFQYTPGKFETSLNTKIIEAKGQIKKLTSIISASKLSLDSLVEDPPQGIAKISKKPNGAVFHMTIELKRKKKKFEMQFRWFQRTRRIQLLNVPCDAFDAVLDRCALYKEHVLNPAAHFPWEKEFLDELEVKSSAWK